ncbi:hypothetical protein CDD83_9922 [Cordyceps sp. RAO-2017]|nr:hypothetical protein CDD83_9922 [Cordyceps sp. RAO-2017]
MPSLPARPPLTPSVCPPATALLPAMAWAAAKGAAGSLMQLGQRWKDACMCRLHEPAGPFYADASNGRRMGSRALFAGTAQLAASRRLTDLPILPARGGGAAAGFRRWLARRLTLVPLIWPAAAPRSVRQRASAKEA